MRKVLIALAALAMLFANAYADTIHVPGDYPTIQGGIDAAVDGDTVLVADGTYTGTGNKNLDFAGRAIVLKSETGPDNCFIDCGGNSRGFYFHSNETRNSIVDGFTIINGCSAPPPPSLYPIGGGIYCCNSSPTIINCHIFNCFAYG